ncbi:hypothetical protein [Crateriforma conspicua]|nr:hypothetical protein [Crateriforma conspicua]
MHRRMVGCVNRLPHQLAEGGSGLDAAIGIGRVQCEATWTGDYDQANQQP